MPKIVALVYTGCLPTSLRLCILFLYFYMPRLECIYSILNNISPLQIVICVPFVLFFETNQRQRWSAVSIYAGF